MYNNNDVLGWWEMVKERSKAWIIRHCKRRTGKFWRQARDLQRELEVKFEEYNVGGRFDGGTINTLKRQLRGMYEDQAKKFLFKIRQETREKGEACTAALFRSVRDRKEKQVIVELKDKKGGSLTKVEEINGYVRDHFKNFFSSREIEK